MGAMPPRPTARRPTLTLTAVALLVAGCSGPPTVSLQPGTTTGPTVKVHGRFDITAKGNPSVGDKYQVTAVDHGQLDGQEFTSSNPGATGAGGTWTFRIVAGDEPGPGTVSILYCYRGCGKPTVVDGRPDRTDTVTFRVE